MLLYVPQETQCTNDMLPLTVESAFPEEAGPLAAGALATPEDFAGDLDAFLGGICADSCMRFADDVIRNGARERGRGPQQHATAAACCRLGICYFYIILKRNIHLKT